MDDEELRDVASRIHSAAIHLLRRVRREDAGMGLAPARASALSVLAFGGPRTLGELAAAEQVTPPTMTRIVAALESDGLVRREPDERDRRVARLHATPRGRRVLEEGRDRRVERVQALLSNLTLPQRTVVGECADLLERVLREERESGARAHGRT